MSSPSESDREKPAAASSGAGPVIDVKPSSILRTRRVPLLAAGAVILVLGILVASYSSWRGGVAQVLAVVGADLGHIEQSLGLPSWMTGESGTNAGVDTAGADNTEPATSGVVTEAAAPPRADTTAEVETPAEPAVADQLEALRKEWKPRLAAIEERLDRLEAADEEMAAGTVAAREQTAGETGELAERLADLETRMEHLELAEEQGGNFPQFMSRLLQIAEQLAAVEARERVLPEQLDAARAETGAVREQVDAARAETGAVREQVSGLEQRIDVLAAQLERPDREQLAFALIGLGQLRIATAASKPWRRHLETLRPVLAGEPDVEAALAALEPGADAGVPSLDRLRAGFPDVARAALQSRDTELAEGLVGEVLARVTSLVTIRQVEDVEPDSLEARVAEAETALAAGELSGAVSALEMLEGAAAAAVADWLAGARGRLAVDAAMASLEAAVLAGLASG
ncbi:MAG: mitofilin family membrane protein [Alphaproteobacteria bacterium]|nr:mitofilin family membrane protein [Alphaproteobacteria bacterium]